MERLLAVPVLVARLGWRIRAATDTALSLDQQYTADAGRADRPAVP
jgi:hypothetical protein